MAIARTKYILMKASLSGWLYYEDRYKMDPSEYGASPAEAKLFDDKEQVYKELYRTWDGGDTDFREEEGIYKIEEVIVLEN